jgi:hypothetical protein
MTVNSALINKVFKPGLDAAFMDFGAYPAQYKELYDTFKSEKQQETDVEMRGLPVANFKKEGQMLDYADFGQMYTTNYLNLTVAVGYKITEEAIDDNLYKSQFPQGNRTMAESLIQFKNIQGASTLNQGFNTLVPIGDGQPLFSQSHPIYNGTVSNTLSTPAALNETSMQDSLILLTNMQNAAGIKILRKPKKLFVPPALMFTANVLLGSKYQTDTANNNISAIYNMGAIPGGYTVNNFLSSPLNWFITTDETQGFKHFIRKPVQVDMFPDISSNILMVRAYERYSFGCSNFRAAVGVQGI